MMLRTLVAAILLQASPGNPVLAPERAPAPPYPFQVGEAFGYVGKLGMLTLGTASMSVERLDTIRGYETFVLRFQLQASTFVFKMDDVMHSWARTSDMVSLRFYQEFDEDGKLRRRYYEIFPDSGFYRERERKEQKPTVTEPLDDAAFFYYIRTTPLEVGKTYTINRYFQQDKNPVTIEVVKREKCDLPDRETTCLVLHPVINAEKNGMFAPRADARIWLTDDARRIPVQIRSKLGFGTVTLKIKSMNLPGQPATTGSAP
ncbi:MAG: DUF3108 domain-containing protein [Gemmatimonadota bacterium]